MRVYALQSRAMIDAIRVFLIRRFELTGHGPTTYKYGYSDCPVESCSRSDVQTIYC